MKHTEIACICTSYEQDKKCIQNSGREHVLQNDQLEGRVNNDMDLKRTSSEEVSFN
jgi:hypothetical protein